MTHQKFSQLEISTVVKKEQTACFFSIFPRKFLIKTVTRSVKDDFVCLKRFGSWQISATSSFLIFFMAVPFCKFCLGLIVSVVVTPPLAKSLDFLFISFRAYCRLETILVSYDVTALFTIVPLDETIYILVNKTFTDDWFNKIMAFICKRTSLLNYSRLPQPINFFSLTVNFTNKQMVWLWAALLAL